MPPLEFACDAPAREATTTRPVGATPQLPLHPWNVTEPVRACATVADTAGVTAAPVLDGGLVGVVSVLVVVVVLVVGVVVVLVVDVVVVLVVVVV